jgi:hypothetical protein
MNTDHLAVCLKDFSRKLIGRYSIVLIIDFQGYFWVNYNDLTANDPWNHGEYGESSPNGLNQISEIM